MTTVGMAELKNALSALVRRAEAGEVITITVQGRAVARLAPLPGAAARKRSPLDDLIATGQVRPPLESGPLTQGWPRLRLPRGTAAAWVDEDRGDR
jgi:prevent-host-death family protein